MAIKAICFDLDGVYFTPGSFKSFCTKLGEFTNEEKATQILKSSNEMLNFKKGILLETEFWDFIRLELKLPYNNEEIFQLLANCYSKNEEVSTSVTKARNSGYTTCICSNNFITRIRELDKKFDFLKDFDVQIFSYNLHELKPSEKIFQALLEQSQVSPSEIIYSDDKEQNLVGAKKLGITTFTFKNSVQFFQELSKNGVELNKQP